MIRRICKIDWHNLPTKGPTSNTLSFPLFCLYKMPLLGRHVYGCLERNINSMSHSWMRNTCLENIYNLTMSGVVSIAEPCCNTSEHSGLSSGDRNHLYMTDQTPLVPSTNPTPTGSSTDLSLSIPNQSVSSYPISNNQTAQEDICPNNLIPQNWLTNSGRSTKVSLTDTRLKEGLLAAERKGKKSIIISEEMWGGRGGSKMHRTMEFSDKDRLVANVTRDVSV